MRIKKQYTKTIYFILLITLLCFTNCSSAQNKEEKDKQKEKETMLKSLSEKSREAFAYCKDNNLNTDFCILIDMKIHSGKNRMFLWNFANDTIERSALCAHGIGKDNMRSTEETPIFSNIEGSYLSSLGKYKLGARSYSQYGINIHYKMHGLEKTNNNAFKRYIVLHSHQPVKDEEIYPNHMPLGWSQGCPVTSDAMMTYLDNKLQHIKKPVLLWIYY